jgi:hypothetical protein
MGHRWNGRKNVRSKAQLLDVGWLPGSGELNAYDRERCRWWTEEVDDRAFGLAEAPGDLDTVTWSQLSHYLLLPRSRNLEQAAKVGSQHVVHRIREAIECRAPLANAGEVHPIARREYFGHGSLIIVSKSIPCPVERSQMQPTGGGSPVACVHLSP